MPNQWGDNTGADNQNSLLALMQSIGAAKREAEARQQLQASGKQQDFQNKIAEQGNQAKLGQQEADYYTQQTKDLKKQYPGDNVSVGGHGTDIGKPNNPLMTQKFEDAGLAKDRAAVTGAVKNLGISDMSKRVTSINSAINNLSLNSNLGDNAAQIQETLSMLGPSAGRALGVVLRQKGIVAPTGDTSLNGIINYVTGRQDPALNKTTADAMVEFLKSQKDQVAQQYGSAKNHLAASLPTIAPHYVQAGLDINPQVALYTGELEDGFKQTDSLVNAYKQPPQATQAFQQPQARSTADSVKQAASGVWGGLKSIFGGGSKAPPVQTPQQPPPQNNFQGIVPQATPAAQNPTVDPIAAEMQRRGLSQ